MGNYAFTPQINTPLVSASYVRPSTISTQYSIGDLIGNSGTASAVTPINFTNLARVPGGSGWLNGMRCVVVAASGTIVLPKFDLLIFRPNTNIPFTTGSYPADNAALNISAAAMLDLVAVFSFLDTGWRNQAGGAAAAGDHIWQAVPINSGRSHASFNLGDLGGQNLLGLMQVQNIWNPGAVVNTFTFVPDVDGN